MNRKLLISGGVLLAALLFVVLDSLFVVEQYEQVIVRQFGAPVRVIQTPGLKAKVPFVQDIVYLDSRLLDIDLPPEQVIMTDQKRLDVDTFTRYRISEPLVFFQALGNEDNARSRLREIISSALRRVLGNISMISLLSAERAQIMKDIQAQVDAETRPFGITLVDVRIRRADLPEETSQAIYDRMKSEREREARENRAQGQELAAQIRSRADREKTVILAEAQKRAQIERGEGDATASKLYADAYSRDPQFFNFFRSLQSYRTALGDKDTTLVLSPDSDFFRYWESASGGRGR